MFSQGRDQDQDHAVAVSGAQGQRSFNQARADQPSQTSLDLLVAPPARWRLHQLSEAQARLRRRLDALIQGAVSGGRWRRERAWRTLLRRRSGAPRGPQRRGLRRGTFLHRVACLALAGALAAGTAAPARLALAVYPVGGETRVNTTTAGAQTDASVSTDAQGNYVIVWAASGQNGEAKEIYAQRFAANGTPRGGESRVTTTTTATQRAPSVTMDADGDYVVAWASISQDDTSYSVYTRRYADDGTPKEDEQLVNVFTGYAPPRLSGIAFTPTVAGDSVGNYVVSWSEPVQGGYSVVARHYANTGQARGDEITVFTTSASVAHLEATTAMSANGAFVIAWSTPIDDEHNAVYVRPYAADDTPQQSEVLVDSFVSHTFHMPSVAMDADGDFVVAWADHAVDADEGSGSSSPGIYVRRYAAGGTPASDELQVSTSSTYWLDPSVAMDADGDFVVAWEHDYGDIVAQPFTADGDRNGGELYVNPYTTGHPAAPSVASDPDGNVVVAWHGLGQYGNGSDIYMQRFDADGVLPVELQTETLVSRVSTAAQALPAVARDAAGNFVVVWQSDVQSVDGDGNAFWHTDIVARRYNAEGRPQGDQLVIAEGSTTLARRTPSVAMDDDGDFVVAWQSWDELLAEHEIYARRYAADGTPAGDEQHVNTITTGTQSHPTVALDADGDFVVAWQSQPDADAAAFIAARRYSADGTAQGAEVRVDTSGSTHDASPSVAMDDDGDFVVAWQSDSYGEYGTDYDIYARRYAAGGTPKDVDEVAVRVLTGPQTSPSVAMDDDGDFVVAWQSDSYDGQGSDDDIFAARFAADGTAEDEILVQVLTGAQTNPSVAMDDDGDFVVVWQSPDEGGGTGIRARRYHGAGSSFAGALDVTSAGVFSSRNPAVGMDSDGDFVIAWQNDGRYGSGYGVLVKRYDFDEVIPTASIGAGATPAEPGTAGSMSIALDSPALAGGLTVGYSVDGTATPGTDYAALSGSVTIPEGQTSAEVVITTLDDMLLDPGETITATLMSGSGYLLSRSTSATLTIVDDDVLTATIAAGTSLAEGGGNGSFAITLNDPAPTGGTMVTYTVGGTATSGSDYTALSGSVTVPAGQTTATITVTALDDAAVEGAETVVVTLAGSAGYVLGSPDSATLTIVDDDIAYAIGVSATSVDEGDSGSQALTFTITRDGASNRASTVDYSLGGTATSSSDYDNIGGTSGAMGTSGRISFASGETSKTITLAVLGDTTFEPDETVVATLSNAAVTAPASGSASITTASATTTIANDDRRVATIAAGSSPAEGGGNGSFTVTLSTPAPAGGTTIGYTVSGTATSGSDYTALSGSVTVLAGQTTATITVAALDDAAVEQSETIIVTLVAGTGYAVGASSSAALTIADDDMAARVLLPLVAVPQTTATTSTPGAAGALAAHRAQRTEGRTEP